MDLPRPFIKLPYQFDAERLATEVAELPDSAWLAHPSGLAGNTAVPLVAQEGQENDAFDGPMSPTPQLERCRYMQQLLASFGQVLGRSRLMKLGPGSEVALHVDFNYHWVSRVRIHVPIVTDPAVLFYCADQRVHMGPGSCWLFNSWRRHRVTNNSAVERIHLVIDTAGSARFWRMVQAAMGHPGREPGFLAFDPAAEPPQLKTERYNTSPVMPPAELDALVNELLSEISAHSGNNPALVGRYRELLNDLRWDWRAAWHQHGPAPAGWPAYRRLLARARQALEPDPRALLLASNGVGANPVIVQRILVPALQPDRHGDLESAVSNAPSSL